MLIGVQCRVLLFPGLRMPGLCIVRIISERICNEAWIVCGVFPHVRGTCSEERRGGTVNCNRNKQLARILHGL